MKRKDGIGHFVISLKIYIDEDVICIVHALF
jgi:hypothetical protein